MGAASLGDLKKENEAKEAAEAAAALAAKEALEADDDEVIEDPPEEPAEDVDEPEIEDDPDPDPDVDVPDEPADEDGAFNPFDDEEVAPADDGLDDLEAGSVPLSTHIRARKKHREERDGKDEVIEKLKAQLAEMDAGSVPAGGFKFPAKPRLEDEAIEYDEEKLDSAIDVWNDQKADIRAQASHQKREAEVTFNKERSRIQAGVDSHFDRAAEYIKKHKIKPEIYQGADKAVRDAVEAALPDRGDMIVDFLTMNLGEGSEAVLYGIGRTPALLKAFQEKLTIDPTGVQAAMFLGEQKARLNIKFKRTSAAPNPPRKAGGDTPGGKDVEKAARKSYKAAHASGNVNEAFRLKREAKEAGADTSGW